MKIVQKTLLLLCGLALLATPAMAEKKIRWKLAMTWPGTLAPLTSPPEKLAQMVEEMSGGNFTIRVEGAERHKAALGILDMVKGGQYQMGHTASYYWKGRDAASCLFTTVPFGMTAAEQAAWMSYGGGQELMQEFYDQFGVYSFPGGSTRVQMGGWFRKDIKSLDDLKGLKMRIPSLAGEIFAKLGVNVTNIPPGELYTALDRGTIDALEWVTPGMDIRMGFYKIAPYYYTGWHEPASDLQFMINQDDFNKLPVEYQAMLKVAIKAVSADFNAESFAGDVVAWKQMKEEFPDVEVKSFPKPVLRAMKVATDEVLDGYAAENPFFKKVLDSQRAWQADAREWTEMSELTYLETSEIASEKE